MSYELRDKDTNKIVENDAVIASLSADTKQTNRTFAAELTQKANYTGDYSDQLNFDISFRETEYTIQYVTDGGMVYRDNPDKPGATDFAIGITNTGDALDDAEILAACKIKNVSDPSEEITLTVTRGEDNTCTVSNPIFH